MSSDKGYAHRAESPKYALVAGLVLLSACGSASLTWAQESTQGEEPTPTSVRGLSGPFAKALEDRIAAKSLFPRLKYNLQKRSSFFADTRADIHFRTYYLDRTSGNPSEQSEAWAIGGWADYASGWYRDWLSFGAAYYLSEKLIGDEDRDGTLLLAPGQEGIAVLGKAYATLKHKEHHAVLYRQEIDLPYVNKQDSRMIPNTFEAYKLDGRFEDVPAAGIVRYVAGYVDEIKLRDSDEFISMSEAAGVGEADRGLVMAGAAVQPRDEFIVGAINHFVDDTLNIFYTEADYHHEAIDGLDVRYQGQFTHQQSVGDNLLTGDDFDTWVLGGRLAASYKGAILKAAFSTTDDGADIRSPYGSYPGYISLIQSDFDLAGMDAWLLGASIDFKELGIEGLSMFANYAEGHDALDAGDGSELPDQREFNITGDYQLKAGLLRGLWFRVRWSTLDIASQTQANDEFRVILNYEIPIL